MGIYTRRLGQAAVTSFTTADLFTVPAGEEWVIKCVSFLVAPANFGSVFVALGGLEYHLAGLDNAAGTEYRSGSVELTQVMNPGDTLTVEPLINAPPIRVHAIASGYRFVDP